MSTYTGTSVGGAEGPLTREDVEKRLRELGSSQALDLRDQDLTGIDLSYMDLRGATLRGASLRQAILIKTNLSEANLRQSIVTNADLSGANLSHAILSGADLSHTILSGADLSEAVLNMAKLTDADLSGADLSEAALSMADLSGANLKGTNLSNANISPGSEEMLLSALGVRIASAPLAEPPQHEPVKDPALFRVQILEQPLTALNLSIILPALTELYTKCWLIEQGRFADIIAYAQSHNRSYTEEANLIVTKIRHNSPADFEFRINAEIKPQSLAETLRIAIDTFTQAPYRMKAAQIENQLKEVEIARRQLEMQSAYASQEQTRQLEAQRADLERQRSLIDLEKSKIELEKQQLELEKIRLELQVQRINIALETAQKMIDLLHPGIDEQAKGMLVQTLLPDLLQLEGAKGITFVQLSGNEAGD